MACADVQNEAAASDQEKEQLQQTVANYEHQLQELDGIIRGLHEERTERIDAHKSEVLACEAQLQVLRVETEGLKASLREKSEELASLRAAAKSREAQRAAHLAKLQTARRTLEMEKENLQDQVLSRRA